MKIDLGSVPTRSRKLNTIYCACSLPSEISQLRSATTVGPRAATVRALTRRPIIPESGHQPVASIVRKPEGAQSEVIRAI